MAGRLRSHRSDNIWPGFVDALATLLLVIMFLLVVFVLAHVFLSQALSGRDEALERLNNQISELANLLALERDTSTELRTNVSQLSASLQQSTKSRDALGQEMETLRAQLAEKRRRHVPDESVLVLAPLDELPGHPRLGAAFELANRGPQLVDQLPRLL